MLAVPANQITKPVAGNKYENQEFLFAIITVTTIKNKLICSKFVKQRVAIQLVLHKKSIKREKMLFCIKFYLNLEKCCQEIANKNTLSIILS